MRGPRRALGEVMSRRDEFEVMIGQRIELASTKTSVLVAAASAGVNADRRKALEDCGLSIALAMASLGDRKAATDAGWKVAERDMNYVWRRMEAAVRLLTGEPAVTLVAPLSVPSAKPLTN